MKVAFIFAAIVAVAVASPVRVPKYTLIIGDFSWETAKYICLGYGSNIARVMSSREHEQAASFVNSLSIKVSYLTYFFNSHSIFRECLDRFDP